MSRYNTGIKQYLECFAGCRTLTEKVLYERAKLILSIYREVNGLPYIEHANDVCGIPFIRTATVTA